MIFEQLGVDIGYVVIGLSVFALILFIAVIVSFVKHKKLKKNYETFMAGDNAQSLENLFQNRFKEIDNLKNTTKDILNKIEVINETLLYTYQKVGIVKYDAFKEMGGKLSFALAMLNESNNGFIINSMHSSREGCYTYVKEIIKGESFVMLAEEEKQALSEALNSKV